MAITLVRLTYPSKGKEGLRIGTVRRPPREVSKSEYAKRDFYDVWLPNLAPSLKLLKEVKAAHDKKSWATFERKFRSEMNTPETAKILGAAGVRLRSDTVWCSLCSIVFVNSLTR